MKIKKKSNKKNIKILKSTNQGTYLKYQKRRWKVEKKNNTKCTMNKIQICKKYAT